VVEAKFGDEFIRHEFDEAIAIQDGIVKAERQLSTSHPMAEGRRSIKDCLKRDQIFLAQLRDLGKPYGASGEVEVVAGSMLELMTETPHPQARPRARPTKRMRCSSASSASNRIPERP
jgi:hypothetical protein